MKTLLGIDVGTTSLKVIVLDSDGDILSEAKSKYKMIENSDIRSQIDSDNLWKSLIKCIKSIGKKDTNILKSISGIGISSLCPGLVGFDIDGDVIVDPIIYSDRRSIKEAEYIYDVIGKEKLFDITGNGSMSGSFSGSSILWIKNNYRSIYNSVYKFGHLNTLLGYKMTGEFGIDYSNASYTNMLEINGSKKWSDYICSKLEIDKNKLPKLMESSDVLGLLNNEDLISVGIPADTPVVIGGADTPCSALAAGVINHGDALESAGTTNVLTICVEKPKFDKRFINRYHVIPDKWLYQGAMSFTGVANEWFIRKLVYGKVYQDLTFAEALEAFNVEASDSEPGSNGVIFLPYLLGERSPIWDSYARGVFFGLSLETDRSDMSRSVLEACGYGLRQMIEIADENLGINFDEIVSIGGGSKSRLWSQFKSDITGKKFITPEKGDYAPIGAALLAGIGVGLYEDISDAARKVKIKSYREYKTNSNNIEIYNDRYNIYTSLYPVLKDLYKKNYELIAREKYEK